MSVNVLIDNNEKQKKDLSEGQVLVLEKLISKKNFPFPAQKNTKRGAV